MLKKIKQWLFGRSNVELSLDDVDQIDEALEFYAFHSKGGLSESKELHQGQITDSIVSYKGDVEWLVNLKQLSTKINALREPLLEED